MALRNKIGRYGILAGVIATLSACAPGMPVDENSSREGSMPDHFSLMALGHALSKGQVDLFDPWLSYYEPQPLPPQKPLLRPLPFPVNPNYKPKDSAVTFFALTTPGEDLEVVDPAPLVQPVPLEIEVESLKDE